MNQPQLIAIPLMSIESVPAPAVLHLTDFGRELPLAGYAWLYHGVNANKWVLIDTGMADTKSINTGQPWSWHTTPVREAMAIHGVVPEDVSDVIITHLHHDHCGSIEIFPDAQWNVPAIEWKFVNEKDNTDLVPDPLYPRKIFARMAQHGVCMLSDGDQPVAGLRVRHTGGHTIGCMAVEVLDGVGDVCAVVAGDVMPMYENLARQIPPGTLWHWGDCKLALKRLAAFDVPVLPSHDPKLMRDYPRGVILNG